MKKDSHLAQTSCLRDLWTPLEDSILVLLATLTGVIDMGHAKLTEVFPTPYSYYLLNLDSFYISGVIWHAFVHVDTLTHTGFINILSRLFRRIFETGWRLDYFLVSESIADMVHDSYIVPDVTGSDHCPIGLVLKL